MVTFIIGIVVFVIVSFYAALIKAARRTQQRAAYGQRRPAFDNEMPTMSDDEFFGSAETDASYAEQPQQQPYFSYETIDTQPADPQPATAHRNQKKHHTTPTHPADTLTAESAEQPFAFDLRQAIIAQTVLSAPYIDDRN